MSEFMFSFGALVRSDDAEFCLFLNRKNELLNAVYAKVTAFTGRDYDCIHAVIVMVELH